LRKKALTMLYELFKSIKTEAEFNELLHLTFTEHERDMMLERWRIFDACDRGLSQRDVAKDVPCSIVTATRGAKVYRDNRDAIRKYLELWREKG
jgi:Trp operon repressor